ncbi:MAG: hypothetical protein H3C47_09895 [Candidatus Cloacimonetes bacterium]|nr:hypothetical protein [Candidatus Cloacimonadota bacterium]
MFSKIIDSTTCHQIKLRHYSMPFNQSWLLPVDLQPTNLAIRWNHEQNANFRYRMSFEIPTRLCKPSKGLLGSRTDRA